MMHAMMHAPTLFGWPQAGVLAQAYKNSVVGVWIPTDHFYEFRVVKFGLFGNAVGGFLRVYCVTLSLNDAVPAVRHHDRAGDKAGQVRGQEDCRPDNVLGFPRSAERRVF